MSFFEFPHTRTYDSDLGWIIKRLVAMNTKLDNFINLNTIKYADPIAWNITTQYEANTVVIDPATGTAYISTRAVPYGVRITNTDYWTPIFNYGESLDTLREQIAAANEGDNWYASAPRAVDELVWVEGILYRAVVQIPQGTRYVPSVNVVSTTVENELQRVSAYLNGLLNQEIVNRTVADETILGEVRDTANALDGRLDVIEAAAGQYYGATFEAIGDSNCYGYGWPESNGQGVFKILADTFPHATFRPVRIGLAWHGVYTQILQITEAPDVLFLWCGGNDISNWIGGAVNLGYPDFAEYELANFDTDTTYGAMNYVLGYVRKNWPTTKIVGVMRTYKADQNLEMQKSIYGTMLAIYHKWKASVINLNDFGQICDASADQYAALFQDAHYNETAYRKFIAPAFIGAMTAGFDVNSYINIEAIYTDADPNTQYFPWNQFYRYFGPEMRERGVLKVVGRSGNFAAVLLQKHGSDIMYLRMRTGFDSLEYRKLVSGGDYNAEVVQVINGATGTNKNPLTCNNGFHTISSAEASSWTGLPVDNTPFLLFKSTGSAGLMLFIAVRYDGVLYTGTAGTSAQSVTWVMYTGV